MVFPSSLQNKLDKAVRYAEEKDRITFQSFQVTIKGDNNDHVVTLSDGEWHCDCPFFENNGRCAHTMTMEIILKEVLPIKELVKTF